MANGRRHRVPTGRLLPWPRAALAGALALLAPVPVRAAAPTFVWESPQLRARAVPSPAPFLLFARLADGEGEQRFYLPLQAGQSETLGVLVPAGRPPLDLTVLGPDGSEQSLPPLPLPQRVWLGPIPLERRILYPFVAPTTGTYAVAVWQPAGTGPAEPYALTGNWSGQAALGPAGPRSLLWPLDVLKALLWLVG
jgi:hypothetical protein